MAGTWRQGTVFTAASKSSLASFQATLSTCAGGATATGSFKHGKNTSQENIKNKTWFFWKKKFSKKALDLRVPVKYWLSIETRRQRKHVTARQLSKRVRHYADVVVAATGLGIQLGAHLILQVDDVFRQVLFLLLHLLQGVRHVLHPTVVVLQSFLDVTNVKPHKWSATGMHGEQPFPLQNVWDCGCHSWGIVLLTKNSISWSSGRKESWVFTGRFCWQTRERTKRVWIILNMEVNPEPDHFISGLGPKLLTTQKNSPLSTTILALCITLFMAQNLKFSCFVRLNLMF